MENEFVPYEQALELKELGFDELCLGYYTSTGYFNSKKELKWRKWIFNYSFQPISNENLTWKDSEIEKVQQVISPLYQQAFRWFREKYDLHSYIEGAYPWFRFYINSKDNIWEGFKHTLYEEAELECLKKLIEIVKQNKNGQN